MGARSKTKSKNKNDITNPEYLWFKSPVRFSNDTRIIRYIKLRTKTNHTLRKKALENWSDFSGKILVGTRSFQRVDKKQQFHYTYGTKNYLFQVDLCDLFGEERTRISEENNGFKYILVFCNVLTKKVWAYPLLNRTNVEIIKILKNALQDAGLGCKIDKKEVSNLQCDQEFLTPRIKAFFKENCINAYYTLSDYKASIVERFIKTLKEAIATRMESNRTEKWLNFLSDFVKQYNTEIVHSVTKMTPEMAEKYPSAALIRILEKRAKFSEKHPRKSFKFKVGDLVRLKNNPDNNPFRKSYRRRFTAKVFVIYKRRAVKYLNVYYLKTEKGKDLEGGIREDMLRIANTNNEFYPYEIKERKGKQVLVSWDGFGASDDEWVNESDLAKRSIK